MKKLTRRLPIIILLILNLSGFKLYGQDVTFTHFLQNPIYYNPASVGIDQGLLVSLNYRKALMYLPSSFETIAFGMDQSLHDTDIRGLGGVGLFLTRNQEGDETYNTTALGIPFASRIIVNDNLKFQVGIAPVIYQKSINFDNLVFYDQLQYYGAPLPQSSLSSPNLKHTVTFFDFHIGIFGRYETDPTDQSYEKNNVFDFGFSIQHLPEPNQAFDPTVTAKLDSKYSLMMRYSHVVASFGYQDASIQPLMLLEKQGSMEDIITGINFKYKTFSLGTYARHEQNSPMNITELMMLIGTEFKLHEGSLTSIQLNYSFDLLVQSQQVNKNISNEVSIILKLPSILHPKDPCHFRF